MGTLVIPDLDDETFARLRAEAVAHGRDEADEARRILADNLRGVGLPGAATESLAGAMRAIFEPIGGHDFPNVRERGSRPPPDFSDPEYGA
ncbi:MAG TPA: plasmid stabilization protein [Acetobacteraceae bacterium]|nr:plasmid stabilization protein [Acetobacteraceae bacterium]